MIKCIEIEKNGIVYCPICHHGEITVIEIKETGEEVYLCDECDSTWIRTDDILNEKKVMSFDAYVLFKKLDGIIDYNNSIILKGYMLYGNIENVAARYGVKVVGPMECE